MKPCAAVPPGVYHNVYLLIQHQGKEGQSPPGKGKGMGWNVGRQDGAQRRRDAGAHNNEQSSPQTRGDRPAWGEH